MIKPDRLLETFLRLVNINSPSLAEAEVAAVIEEHLQGLGFSTERDDAGEKLGGNTGNIIARRKGTTSAPPVFFNAHMDTVQPTPNIQVIVADGIVRTDGTTILGADDKAGVACILEALESGIEDGAPSADTEVIITVAEEIGLCGAKMFDADRIKARSGWVVDSGYPLNSIITEAPSQDKIHATITGRAAHAGSQPEAGISAITVAARAIAAMPQGRIDEETTSNVGIISGGQATNIVAPECSLDAESRSRSEAKLEKLTKQMTDALETAARDAGATVDIKVERAFSTFFVEPDAREVIIAGNAMRAQGMEPMVCRSGGGMDANFFNRKGMACVVVGCGYKDIHTTAEHIAVEDMATGARTVENIMRLAAEG